MSWYIPAALAAFSGLSNLFSSDAQQQAEQRRINAATQLLSRNIVDDAELSRMLRNQNRMFNVQLQNTLNTTALRSKGIANREVVGAAASGQINAARTSSLANTEERVRESNAQTRAQIASVQAGGQTYSDPIGSFIEGAVPGAIAGLQLTQMDKLSNTSTSNPNATENALFKGTAFNTTNPFQYWPLIR